MTRDIFNKLIDELDASSKNVLKNKNALYGKKMALANRCWTLTRGAMCIFCELDAFKCPHAMSNDQKIKVAKKMMRETNNA